MRSGLTLIELTIVLFILGLLTHFAVIEASRVREEALVKAASRQFDEISSAVLDWSSGEPSGFLLDMGRLPETRYLDDNSTSGPLSLRELWDCPKGVGRLAARPASPENLASDAPPAIADPTVLIPCGWGGPYLRMARSGRRLLDPWGNPLESPDEAGYSRLCDANSNGLEVVGLPIECVRHFGKDGVTNRVDESYAAKDASLMLSDLTRPASILLTFRAGVVTNLYWYRPCGDKIAGGIASVADGASQAHIDGMTPGICFLKIFRRDLERAEIRQVFLPPGRVVNLYTE